MKTKPNQTSPHCPCSQHPDPYFRHPANSSQSNALTLWLDFSSRFQRSPRTDSHHPCSLLWFRLLEPREKFRATQLIKSAPTSPNLSFPVKCWSLGDAKQVAKSTSPALSIPFPPVLWNVSQTLEPCAGVPAILDSFHTASQSSCLWMATAAVECTQSGGAHLFRMRNEEGDHVQ